MAEPATYWPRAPRPPATVLRFAVAETGSIGGAAA
jgi:hypothetical protein